MISLSHRIALAAASIAATCLRWPPASGAIRAAAEIRRHARRSAPSMSRSRRCRGIPPTGTGSTTTTPALVYEQLFVADLSKSKRLGGKHPFYADAWIPSDAIQRRTRRELEWKQNPLRLEINLRKGVMFPEKPGVMAAREMVADDVVFAYNRLDKSPKKIPAISIISTRSRPPTSIRWCSPSRTTTPSGIIASAGATIPASCRKRSPTPAPATGRTSTAPGRSCLPISCRAIPTPTSRTRTTGAPRRSTASTYKLPLRRQGGLSHHQG